MNKTDDLRRRINNYTQEARSLQAQLNDIEQSCTHSWSPVEKTYVRVTNYRVGTLASSWVSVPIKEEEKIEVPTWSRTCSICGKTEKTTHTENLVTVVPRF